MKILCGDSEKTLSEASGRITGYSEIDPAAETVILRIADDPSGDAMLLWLHYPEQCEFSNRIDPWQSGSSAANRL